MSATARCQLPSWQMSLQGAPRFRCLPNPAVLLIDVWPKALCGAAVCTWPHRIRCFRHPGITKLQDSNKQAVSGSCAKVVSPKPMMSRGVVMVQMVKLLSDTSLCPKNLGGLPSALYHCIQKKRTHNYKCHFTTSSQHVSAPDLPA